MKITLRKTITFLKLCSILIALTLGLFLIYAQGYRINVSDSLPHRIYVISKIDDKPVNLGDYVVVDNSRIVHEFGGKTESERMYFNGLPMIKQIGAVPGDVVLLQDNRLFINGIEFSPMVVLSSDSHGNTLQPYPTPVTLQPEQYWLISNPDKGFDSRYFGWISRDCITHIAQPVF